MRICHIGFNFFPGQGLTIFYELARHQARLGLAVTAIAPGRPGEPAFEVLEGVRLHRVSLQSIGRFSLDRARFVRQASRILRGHEVDLVHTYAFVGAGLLPLLGPRAPVRWLYDCQTSAIKPPLLNLQNRLIEFESRSFDATTVLSPGIRNIVFGSGGRVAGVVPLGADFEHFRPRPPDAARRSAYGLSERDRVLLYCGSLDHDRKLEKLLDAFAFAVGHGAPDAKLLLVGDGSARQALRARARALGLERQVVFTGFVPYRDIPACLSLSSVALAFVSMDACFEHQPPTKTVEYLAQGLPVVATDTAGNRAFVEHDVNGILAADTAQGYGQALLELLDDPDRRLRLAAKARSSVRAFEWGNIVESKVIQIYERVLRGVT